MAQSEEMVAEDHSEKQPEKPPIRLYVVSTARRQATRALRRRPIGGKRHRFNLRICGGKMILRRNKALPLPDEMFEQYEKELAQLMRAGQIDIREGGPYGRSIGLPPEELKSKAEVDPEAEPEETPEESAELEEEEEPSEEVEVEVEEESELPEPDKPLERMNKSELIDYCVQVTGMDADELEGMVKREILEAIQGALQS